MKKIFVTGIAGFIGFHLAQKFANAGHEVVGVDNVNDYYDVRLKENRLKILEPYNNIRFIRADIADKEAMTEIFIQEKPDYVVHLAAQAGVRYSLENPQAYIQSNIVGFVNLLECCRIHKPQHFVYASSSSVYGANTEVPFSVSDDVDHPVSLYAATKKSNELIAHTYSHLFDLPTTGLRFFTVYGPWGRPDMAIFKFTKAILAGETMDVYNHGNMERDFTYIDDIVEGIYRVTSLIPKASNNPKYNTNAQAKVYNIGNNQPVKLMYMIAALEKVLGKSTEKNMMPIQPGDVPKTFANIDDLMRDTGFKPETPIEVGLENFVSWYREYHNLDTPSK